jgi:two-component system nitrate/nitrite response regulator NarL
VGGETGCGVPVLVVDDDADSRALIVELLERIGCTPHEVGTGEDALRLAESVRPELVIVEVALPGLSGYEVCRELRDRFGDDLSLVFVSATRVEQLDRIAGFLIGADDYIVKPFDPEELLARMRGLLRRTNSHRQARTSGDGESELAALTRREREVLALLAQGHSQDVIAGELFISSNTVATHLQRVLSKLGVHSRAQAVALAHQQGIVDADVEAHALAASPPAAA